jgi:acetyl esterase/lipase
MILVHKARALAALVLLAVILVASLAGIQQLPLAQSAPTYPVEVATNLAYYNGPDFDPQEHVLDIYEPKGLSNAPVLIFIHGGGWTSGDKNLYPYLGRAFASQGFTTAIINYRLTPEVMHPGHIEDVARAFAWVYRNIAQYGGNAKEIFVTGHSAGGHLAALLALDGRYLQAEGLSTDLIKGVMPISGVYDLNAIPGFDSVFTSDPAKRGDASPVAHVGDKEPPFLIIYGQFDYPTADFQAKELFNLLQQHQNEAKLLEIPLKDHITIITSIGQPGDLTTEAIVNFMNEHLP